MNNKKIAQDIANAVERMMCTSIGFAVGQKQLTRREMIADIAEKLLTDAEKLDSWKGNWHPFDVSDISDMSQIAPYNILWLTVETDFGYRHTIRGRWCSCRRRFIHASNAKPIKDKVIAWKKYCGPKPYKGDLSC